MNPQTLSFVRLMFIVLLPIVPAFVLFFALPSKAVVSGLFQGWKVNLGGAFGAYFALVLIIISTVNVWAPPPNFQVWTVDGTVMEGDGTPVRFLQDKDFTASPPWVSPNRDTGTFQLQFNTAVGTTGNITYPSLTIIHEGFLPREIELDPTKGKDSAKELDMQWDHDTQHVHIGHLVLHRPAPYAPVGQPPAPLPSSEAPHP